ncbi:hypothetical protein H4582DRAFT_1962116 [Lactarius indigo]|nr:hypothetical protein H4582DRAFT_1962116 [Lactarius indigo]
MPDHQVRPLVRPQQADHLSAETTLLRSALHQPHDHAVQNAAVPLPAYDGSGQQQVHQEGVPLPAENAAMRGLIQDPPLLPPLYYDAAYNQRHPDYPVAQHAYMQQDGRVVQGIPLAARPQEVALASIDDSSLSNLILTSLQEVQENHEENFGYAPADPAVGRPQYFPGPEPLPYPAPLANAPPADGLRNLAGRYVNSPGTRVNMLRIEPGLAGNFEVWIVLEIADIL